MENWIPCIVGLLLALLIIGVYSLAILRRNIEKRQLKTWPELARRTGLSSSSEDIRPNLCGDYRGRYLSVSEFIQVGGNEDVQFPLAENILISLYVNNNAHFSFALRAKSIFAGIFDLSGGSGDSEFDRRFHIEGLPLEYLQRSIELILRGDQRLLAWMLQNRPSIKLKGENLFCWQNGIIANVDDQLALLNLLCELAELAEEMGSKKLDVGYTSNRLS